ncbi:MAG TPA: DsrE family protein [Guyparkeria sp.]|nr:DsrE family protein [Guyparkeria sp.]
MTTFSRRLVPALLLTVSSLFLASTASAEALNNKAAIGSLENIKAVYDVRKSSPQALDLYLKAIITNVENLKKEGVQADLTMVFIAQAVKYIHTAPTLEEEATYGDTLESIARSIEALQEAGVRMEACNGATRAYNVDNDTLLPGIEPVRSGFIALMGYQNNGYALVPVYD